MKKICSLILTVLMVFTACIAVGCQEENIDKISETYCYYVEYAKSKGEPVMSFADWEKVYNGEAYPEHEEDDEELIYVISVSVNEKSELIITYSDGRVVNAGSVKDENVYETEVISSDVTVAVEKVKRSSVAITSSSGSGSGILVDLSDLGGLKENEVYILTCYHMIEDKGILSIYIPDKSGKYDNPDYIFGGKIGNEIYIDETVDSIDWGDIDVAVTLIGGDKDSDVAVLKLDLNKRSASGNKLELSDLVLVELPSSDYKTQLGEQVFAIGNPTGKLPGTVSTGTIGFLEREDVYISDLGNMALMQIDVSINPGNSGGGLYNLNGELIGITNAGNTEYTNINFAIPIELSTGNGFLNIAKDLIETKTDTNYGYVRNRKQKFGFTTAQKIDVLHANYYLEVTEISLTGLAKTAGLKVGDRVISGKINDGEIVEFSRLDDLTNMLSLTTVGDTVTIYITRGEEEFGIQMDVLPYRFCDTGK